MFGNGSRALKVFLCHASGDKPRVRDLYKRLLQEGVDVWLDQEKLLPGQDWRIEIPRAVQESDVVVVCLSDKSVTKEGYIQKEIKFALDVAQEKPDGAIFLIPARIEECPVPETLSRWQWVDLFEENGHARLLRSLKLRADKVGAVISPTGYVDDDTETMRRLDLLYTEGLAAFYTEDWDRACQRFQMILAEKPNHKDAGEKLESAQIQRDLSRTYQQAVTFLQKEDWAAAIKSLEEILKKNPDYKDADVILKNARKQSQLKERYSEARMLYGAQKWQAVIKVFDQIHAIDPGFVDSENLLATAQKESAVLKKMDELNSLYAKAVRAMDAGNWQEAKNMLETVHTAQTGYMDTDRLLKKAAGELSKLEGVRKRSEQIGTLYEQAHGHLRTKNWRKALSKIEEIQTLDADFDDKDAIAEQARTAIASEEQQALRQNQLAALYAESVRLMKDGQYQAALEKWNEVKAGDPKYPDRQRVQKTAQRNLTATAQKYAFSSRKYILGFIGILIVAMLIGVFYTNIISLFQPTRTEFPIRLVFITSSDWTKVNISSGGTLTHVKISNASIQATESSFVNDDLYLRQTLGRANGLNTVEMTVDATLSDLKEDTQVYFYGERGCIGATNVKIYYALEEPVLLKTLVIAGTCGGNGIASSTVIIPASLFYK